MMRVLDVLLAVVIALAALVCVTAIGVAFSTGPRMSGPELSAHVSAAIASVVGLILMLRRHRMH